MRRDDNLVILLAFLVFTGSNYIHPVNSLGAVVNYFFKTLHHKDLPTSVDPYTSSIVRSLSLCTALCARNATCKSVYYASNPTSSSSGQPVTCSLIDEFVNQTFFSSGEGTYAYLKTFSTMDDPPGITDRATYLYMGRYNEGLVAVYDFGTDKNSLDKIGVMYDSVEGKWPTMTGHCAGKLYLFKGIRGSVITITDGAPRATYRIHAHCQENEKNWGDAYCSGTAGWSDLNPVGVPCVSSQCYRVDHKNNRAQYSGTVWKTKWGTHCKAWSEVSYRYDSQFPVDGNLKSNAKNYCRDPHKYGNLFCHFQSSYGWCGIPLCSWKLDLQTSSSVP